MGASTSLDLMNTQEASIQATKIAQAYNASATGLNLVAQNLGSGLAGEMAPSFNKSNKSLGPAVFALASGIGNATAMGLKLTQEQFLPSKDSSLEALAGNFGLGVTMPIASKIDVQALMRSLNGSGATSMLMQNLPEIAAAAGMGLGEGAKTGLGLVVTNQPPSGRQKRQQINDPLAGVNISQAVSSFTKGLSQSFIQGSNLSKLNPLSFFGLPGLSNLRTAIRPLAAGAGAGIGMGFAVGLKLKDEDAAPLFGGNITGEDRQVALVAEGFVQNLVSNFLIDSTALQAAGQLIATSPSLVNPAKAAEGFGRGTVEGILNAMSSVGGVKNLISGDVSPDAILNVPVLSPTDFDDSLNGSSVAFARGLTGEGTILIAEIIRNLTQVRPNSTSPPPKRNVVSRGDEAGVGKISQFSSHSPCSNISQSLTTSCPLARRHPMDRVKDNSPSMRPHYRWVDRKLLISSLARASAALHQRDSLS